MKKLFTIFFSEKGLTLIEILASIVILSIIIMSLLSVFIQSSRSNSFSKNIMDATYIAESSMEEISNSVTASTSLTNLNLIGYTKKCSDGSCYEKSSNTKGHYVYVELVPKGTQLVNAKVKVYNNNSSSKKLEAQMELLLSWKQ
jgi:prepilin-type N-terminal cleavage/methylation domain-containing protein